MKLIRPSTIVCVFLIVSGCGSDDEPAETGAPNSIDEGIAAFGCTTGEEAIIGCWVTQQCDEAIHNGTSLGRWVNRVYNFKTDGTTKSVELQYDNSNCSGTPVFSPPSPFPDPLTYTVSGPVTTSDGYGGMVMALYHSIFNEAYGAVYHISNTDALCFSTNIVLGALQNTYRQVEATVNIDFDNCLLPVG